MTDETSVALQHNLEIVAQHVDAGIGIAHDLDAPELAAAMVAIGGARFARDPDIETIKSCIKMGFDDVIALPFASGDIGDRIARQVGRIQTYYETSTYFGPDRRNRVGNSRSADSDHGGGQFRRIEIMRNPDTGIELLRDDFQVVV